MTNTELDRLIAGLADRYRVESELGHGGMSTVYLADDLKHERQVAIKVLQPELAKALGSERFLREIKIAAQLNHPHIISLYDSGKADGVLYYVMPYIPGESLRQRLDREKQLPLTDALRITTQVASALSYAHGMGIVHRDVKPENILFAGEEALVTDFGIARAISQVEGDALTHVGLAVGTPSYMAPEQAAGSEHQDQRVDIYALGSVLYEMLAGTTPFPGPNLETITRRRQVETPPSITIMRPAIPPEVEEVVMKALAITPADRFTTAGQMARELEQSVSGERTAVGDLVRRLRKTKRLAGTALVAAVVLVGAFLGGMVFKGSGMTLNEQGLLLGTILPAGSPADSLLARRVENEAYDAVRQVPQYTVAETTRVADSRARRGEPKSVDDWLDIALDLGYARLLLLVTEPEDDAVQIIAQIWDVAKREQIGRTFRIEADGADLRTRTYGLVEDLFDLADGALSLNGSENPKAQEALILGISAFVNWDLDQAELRLTEATELDPDYALAYFELAKVRSFRGDPSADWRVPAQRAVLLQDRLSNETDRQLARALLAMAEGRFPEACEAYERLVAADPVSFQAWFGLGECHRLDHVVVESPDSPSGWMFRASTARAIEAYREALVQAPAFMQSFRQAAYPRLARLFFVYNTGRQGHAAPPDTLLRFAATPALAADTLAFIPYPLDDFLRGATPRDPAAHEEAVEWSLAIIGGVVQEWATQFPASSPAHQANALVLEGLGRITTQQQSAMESATLARQTALTPEDSIYSGVLSLRLLVKTEQFSEARVLADALLAGRPDLDAALAYEMAGSAALIGRGGQTAALLARAAPQLVRVRSSFDPGWGRVALPVVETRERLRAYASLGGPRDSLVAMTGRIDSLLEIYEGGSAARRDTLRWLLMDDLAVWAYPVVGLSAAHRPDARNRMLIMQWQLSTGDTAAVRETFALLDSRRATMRQGDVSTDRTLQEAWLRLQIADTAGAVTELDRMIRGLPAQHLELVREPQQAAGVARGMALRATLAARAGDAATARRLASAVIDLWSGDDDATRGLVDSMRVLLP